MTRLTMIARRYRRRLLVLPLIAAGILTYALTAGAATVIPVPDALVVVKTKSGGFERTSLVPIGGAPIPIDVDGPSITGLLEPDIDVSVGLVALDELPDKPIVPNVVIRRNVLAIATGRKAPPLEIDAKIVLRDLGDELKPLVELHYGYTTPPGARIPPVVSAKLVGPIQGGFIDPLHAKIESPGYSGPLDIHLTAQTADLDAKFGLGFDALPESIFLTEDPREDGLDATYTHQAPVADVHLDATASLKDRSTGELLEVGANIERLPQRIVVSNTNTAASTLVTYDSSSALARPDIEASYRDTDGSGKVRTDAEVKVAGLPFKMRGKFDTVEEEGKRVIDKVDFAVLDGAEIEAVDFVARNYVGPAGNLPVPQFGPEQFVAISNRPQDDGTARYRAAGRLLGVRSIVFERQGDENDVIDARTDIGNGIKPLRAIVDVDNRAPGAPNDAKWLKLDTKVTPLPRQIHTRYEPAAGNDPTEILYESGQVVDVDADAIIAEGAADGCGQAEVTCAKARVDKIPGRIELSLPGADGTDFSISHDGGSSTRPDVRAVVDTTDDEAERTYADVRILRVPNEVTGRLDTKLGVLRAAEFHGCKWDFGADPPACTDTQQALGRVSFTVRDHPDRGSLPPRPDTARQFVTLLKRDERFEAAGSVDEVRNVVFRQRDANDDGLADGTLGALVDAGTSKPFDVEIDDVSDFPDPDDETEPIAILGKGSTRMSIGVEALPETFSACVREGAEVAPPNPGSLPQDDLLAPCDRDDVLGRSSGDLEVTPLSILYTASSKTKVEARIESEAPDKEDKITANTYHRATDVFATTVDAVPAEIRTDVIGPVTPDADADPPVAGRKLELDYDASERIDIIDFEMQNRRATSICEDPRPNRRATCLSARVTDLPDDVSVSYDPDDSKGDIEFITAAPKETGGGSCTNGTDDDGDSQNDATDPDCVKLSVNKETAPGVPEPLRLSIVNPEPTAQPLLVDVRIKDITDHLKAKLVSKDVDGEGGLGPSKCSNGIDEDGDAGESGGGIDAADDDCEKDMARLSFDACPDGPCPGIGEIQFKATNALIGDPLPQPSPTTASLGGVTQDFSFVQREELFRAQGKISQLKRIGLAQVDDTPAQNPSATTRIGAAFGSGLPSEKIRAYIDTDSGAEQLLADAVISQAPSGINLCLRDAIPGGSDFVSNGSSSIYCETAPNDQMAMQVALDEPAGGAKPDIDLRQLRIASGGGNSLITGDAQVDNLGERIDVLVGKQAKDGDIQIEGQQLGDDNTVPVTSPPDNVAGRVTFNLRNRADAPSGAFPWTSIENGDANPSNNTVDPEAVAAGNDGNYLKFFTDPAGRFIARGSVPDIKRIAKREGPCETDARFPTAGYSAIKRPAYSCLNAIVAGNSKLGLNVRTLDAENEILAVEEGHVTSVPSGGLQITLAKSPDAAGLDPVCNAAASAFPCRPPMLSLEAPRGGAPVPRLRAKLSVGSKDLIVNKLLGQVADDVISKKVDYEQPPQNFAEAGARVKVGTDESPAGKDLLGIRMNANLPLHQFLDLDPPTLWSCKHTAANPDPDPATECSASDSEASSDRNRGFESKDIFFKLVAADSDHDGSDVPFLGRIAVLVQDYKSGGTQTVLTGAPAPDNKTWFTPRAGTDFADQNETSGGVTGADSHFPENFAPDSDPSHLGFKVPGHLDAKVYLRNDYNAADDDETQQNFAQVDGRVNSPLTMAVRLNDGTKNNRAGQAVPPTQLTLRNAPGTNGANNYGAPSFRVRAELKKDFVDLEETLGDAFVKKVFECDGTGYGLNIPGFFTLCFLLPVQSQDQWLDVGLNMDPGSNGNSSTGSAARTVDAVAGPFGGTNEADLRGFTQVNGTGGDPDVNKGSGAGIVPQAGLRLTNFNLGIKVGAGIGLFGGSVTWVEEGDIILGLTGENSNRARLSHNLVAMKLSGGTTSNKNRISTNLKSIFRFKITAEALFGLVEGDVLNETVGPFHHDIVFRDCEGNFLPLFSGAVDEFRAPDPGIIDEGEKAAIAFGSTGDLSGDLAASFNNVVVDVLSTFFCLFPTENSKDVNASHPAPRYTGARPVENGPAPAAGGAPPDANPVPDEDLRRDLTISAATPLAERTRCGAIDVKKLTVDSGVTLRVGREGEFDGVKGAACDGRLSIDADNVEINGTIDAVGARTSTAGPGAGGSPGGGAGHHGPGGASGGGGSGGAALPNTPAAVLTDFGSAGANGSGGAPGGRGGGTVQIAAINEIVVNGAILARGTAGAGAAATCNNVGAGGGSGGAIGLTGTRVVGSGTISTSGGSGGAAARGGGGGSAGRVTVNAVSQGASGGLFFANPGGGGAGAADCGAPAGNDHGSPGAAGRGGPALAPLGTALDRAAGVYLHEDNPGPFVKGSVKLRVKGVQRIPSGDPDAGAMDIVLCRRYLDPVDTNGPFEDSALDPGPGATLDGLLTGDSCSVVDFTAPNVGNDSYSRTVTVSLPTDGFYGWYAIAAKRPTIPLLGDPGAGYCDDVHGGGFFDPDCDYQSVLGSGGDDDVLLPRQAVTRIGSDTTAPSYTTTEPNRPLNGVAGCPDSSLCLADSTAKLKITAADGTSGVKKISCTVAGGPGGTQLCPEGGSVNVDVGTNDGLKTVNVRMEDSADDPPETVGNVSNFTGGKWFTDRTKPNQPVVTLGACSGGANGWCTTTPTISATGSDNNPSSGFNAGALSVLIDEGGNECGSAAAGSSSGAGTTAISCPSGTVSVLTEGRHSITAVVTDRLGNESDRAVVKTMKVDTADPKSAIFIGPKKPDGSNNWYRTRPFVAFGATDKAGGSGVDEDISPSGIFYAIDGGPSGNYLPADFTKFDPDADIRLQDGVHEVCWYAVDVAGNDEAGGDPKDNASATNCKADIKVDSTAPNAQDPIVPGAPDGNNSFYIVKPTINGTADDPQGINVNQVSGIDRVEQEFDGDGWGAAAPTVVQEGEHVVRTRAFDKAGNPSPLLERVVRVDASDPSATLVTYPPRPNDQGWFRKRTINSIAAHDGRDGSGADSATFTVDGGAANSYLEPFPVTDGSRTVTARARDFAGRQGAVVSKSEKIDTLIPVASPVGQSDALVLNALIPKPTKLRFSASDQLGPRVKVRIHVYDELGKLHRRLDVPGSYPGGYRDPGSGSVDWNGRNQSNQGVFPGLYHYRVHVTDQAGNTVLSHESPNFLVLLGLLPR